MISRVRQPAPRTNLPLRQLALCLDCDECFEIGSPTCPACGSATWTSLSRFLAQTSSAPGHRDAAAKRPDDPPEMVRQLIIVAGDRAHLYDHLKRGFAGNGTVRVLLNRRVIARRARSGPLTDNREVIGVSGLALICAERTRETRRFQSSSAPRVLLSP